LNTKKFYFLPFLDNLISVLITFLFLLIFGNWFSNRVFNTIATMIFILIAGGRIYSRMWKLSRKNTLRGYGPDILSSVKFILPLVVFDIIIITFYCLCETGIIPLQDIIVKTYYEFPENLARVKVQVSLFEYIGLFIKFWFIYLAGIMQNGFVLFIAPVIAFLSSFLGFYMGSKDNQILEHLYNLTEKAKKKFNE